MLYALFWVIPRRLKCRRRGITQKKAYNMCMDVGEMMLTEEPEELGVKFVQLQVYPPHPHMRGD